MNIVVIGGSGLIGSKLVNKLRKNGHDPLAAAPDTGVDTLTGEGLAEALEGAQVVVDVANAPESVSCLMPATSWTLSKPRSTTRGSRARGSSTSASTRSPRSIGWNHGPRMRTRAFLDLVRECREAPALGLEEARG